MCYILPGDLLSRKVKDEYELAVRCLGALIWYLKFCYLDQDILSLKLFTEYVPLDHQPADKPQAFESSRMVSTVY